MAGESHFSTRDRRKALDFLICFAVKEEVKYFNLPDSEDSHRVLVTGIGRRNASESIRDAITEFRPGVVLTCGFAGGLNPRHPLGTVLFDQDPGLELDADLEELGVTPGKFYCSRRIAITVEEKYNLWQSTSADAVEMESSVIRNICRTAGIPSATIRVISDTAHDDLPLDFNALMTSNDRLNYPALAWKLLWSPRSIAGLIEFQKQTIVAAVRLGQVLNDLLKARSVR